ncbi:MAG TPA: GNAT family N-acetyltransferase [Acidimicrobiales bacterium]|nr:GNAT family N-acetyltransferase [Acidimicrobiales bacterium]
MSDELEFRSPRPGEAGPFFTPVLQSFGDQPSRADIDQNRSVWEPERCHGALDGDRWVGVSGAFSLEVTLPGGASVPFSGITMIGVAPTHRRRGVLTTMMQWLLDDAEQRGEAAAMLTASESSIYGRYGFGVAAQAASHEIEVDRAAFRDHLDVPGSFTLLPLADALDVVHGLWERCRAGRVGEVSRQRSRWEDELLDREQHRHGLSALFLVVHEGPDGPDGFATYRQRNIWGTETHRLPETRVVLDTLCGTTRDVEAALWQYLASIDLVREVEMPVRPVDDPIRWRLVEPRRLKVTSISDWLWARLLDVAAALAARSYSAPGALVLDVVDPFRPSAAGRFRLEAGGASEGDGASCTPAPEASPDLTLGAEELGALWLGGVAPSVLAAAGRVDEHTPGALALADRMFPVHPGPFCNTMF